MRGMHRGELSARAPWHPADTDSLVQVGCVVQLVASFPVEYHPAVQDSHRLFAVWDP